LVLDLQPAPFELNECAGVPIFFAAFFLRIWARQHIGEHSRGNELACDGVVKTGPYKHIKHPLYLSNFMAGVAFALFHAGLSLATLGFCAIYGFFLVILAINENRFLKHTELQVSHPVSHISSFKKSAIDDLPTWLWQIIMLALIFLRKM
jgi:protein-S-isoprenylcysteine O-methyltransferase Ste14